MADLAKRKSHAEHETQRVLADFLFFFLEELTWRHPILRLKAVFALFRVEAMHKDCCDIDLNS